MNNIESFQVILNNTSNNRFAEWSQYRAEITNYIISKIITNSPAKTLILGVGNSDDLDLKLIEDNTSSLTLTDIDLKSVKTCINKYNLDHTKSFIKKLDYIGLNNSDYWNNFINSVLQFSTIVEINKYLDKIKTVISSYNFYKINNYDLIIVSPIYTQLFLNQALMYLNILENLGYKKELLLYFKDQFLKIAPLVISTFNNNLVSLAEKNGKVIIMSDIFEANYSSKFYKDIESLDNLDKVLDSYQKEYGVGLGDFGLIDIGEKLNFIDSKWFKWPFDNEKCMFIKVNEYRK